MVHIKFIIVIPVPNSTVSWVLRDSTARSPWNATRCCSNSPSVEIWPKKRRQFTNCRWWNNGYNWGYNMLQLGLSWNIFMGALTCLTDLQLFFFGTAQQSDETKLSSNKYGQIDGTYTQCIINILYSWVISTYLVMFVDECSRKCVLV
jgi:hypothetical protein